MESIFSFLLGRETNKKSWKIHKNCSDYAIFPLFSHLLKGARWFPRKIRQILSCFDSTVEVYESSWNFPVTVLFSLRRVSAGWPRSHLVPAELCHLLVLCLMRGSSPFLSLHAPRWEASVSVCCLSIPLPLVKHSRSVRGSVTPFPQQNCLKLLHLLFFFFLCFPSLLWI